MEQPLSRKWSEKWCCRRLALWSRTLPEGVFNLVMGPAVGGGSHLRRGDMQASALGLSLEVSPAQFIRRTAERLRDAIERLFPQMSRPIVARYRSAGDCPAAPSMGLPVSRQPELAD
jgi:hypothetical protein